MVTDSTGIAREHTIAHATTYPPCCTATLLNSREALAPPRASSAEGRCSSLLLLDGGLDFLLELLDAFFKVFFLAAQVLVLSLERLDISVTWRAEALLDELNSIAWFLGLLVKTNEHLGEVVNDAGPLEVLAELLLLLLSGLHAH